MKHWHYMAKIYSADNMALINISSGVITTPNSMSASETMSYLSNMVTDQNYNGEHPIKVSFDSFSLTERDDVEPSAPLTDEDLAQHRHDDKVESQAFAASGLIGMSREDAMEKLEMCASDPANNTQIAKSDYESLVTCRRCKSYVDPEGLHRCINGTMLPRL